MQKPDLQNTEPSNEPTQSSTWALKGLFALAILYTLYFSAALVLPIITALLLSLMLATPVRWLCQIGLPRSISAVTVVLVLVMALGNLVVSLAEPANTVISKSPAAISRIEKIIKQVRKPLDDASKVGEKFTQMGENVAPKSKIQTVNISDPAIIENFMQSLPMIILNIVGTLFLTVIFLTNGANVLRKLVELAPQLNVKKDIINASRNAQQDLSRYVLTVTVINFAFGAVVALALWLIGVDQPILWGGIAALLNFAPYVGMACTLILLTIAGFMQFDSIGMALLVPGIFVVINLLESEVFTPLILGKSMEIDPLVIILTLLVLGWMWGVVGILIAVPLLTCLKIISKKNPSMSAFSHLISDSKT